MTRFAVLADIHSNTAALEVVFEEIDRQNVDSIYCVGDIVGYNPDASRCLEMVRDRGVISIGGNHDRYVATGQIAEVRPATAEAVEYTRKNLSAEQLEYLANLGDSIAVDDRYLMVHGSPRDRDEYIITGESARENLKLMQERYPGFNICFFGHCHLPMVVGAGKAETSFPETATVKIEPNRVYLVNPGSVGQPRDRCNKTSFGIHDTETLEMTIFRIDYPIKTTQDQIAAAGLDSGLSKRLEKGI